MHSALALAHPLLWGEVWPRAHQGHWWEQWLRVNVPQVLSARLSSLIQGLPLLPVSCPKGAGSRGHLCPHPPPSNSGDQGRGKASLPTLHAYSLTLHVARHSDTNTRKHPSVPHSFTYSLWMLSCYNGRVEQLWQKLHGLASLKHLLLSVTWIMHVFKKKNLEVPLISTSITVTVVDEICLMIYN